MKTEQARYEIRIKEHLNGPWAALFEDLDLQNGFDGDGSPITILSGVLSDQSHLHGILAKIRDLGMTIISLNRIS